MIEKPKFVVTYKEKEYTLYETLDVIFHWEETLDKCWVGLIGLNSTYKQFIYIYSMFVANGVEIDFNDFKTYVDENRDFINKFFSEWWVNMPKQEPETNKKKVKKIKKNLENPNE